MGDIGKALGFRDDSAGDPLTGLYRNYADWGGDFMGGFSGRIGEKSGAISNYEASLDPSVLQQQRDFISQLQMQSSGTGGPNLAQQQFNVANQQNLANTYGMAAGARGVNPSLALRQAQQASAKMGAQNAGQSAVIAAQQQLAAQQLMGQQMGQMQTQNLQAQGINAQTAATNAQVAGNIAGGMMSGAGSAMSMFGMAHGGQVPQGAAPVPGDSPINDTVPTNLSPNEIVIPRSITMGPDAPQRAAEFVAQVLASGKHQQNGGMAEGGVVDPNIIQGTQNYLATLPDTAIAPPDPYAEYYRVMAQNPTAAQKGVAAGTLQAPPSIPQKIGSFLKDLSAERAAEEDRLAGIQPQPTKVAVETPIKEIAEPIAKPLDYTGAQAQSQALMSGIGMQKAGIAAEAKAAGDLGSANAQVLENQQKQMNDRQVKFDERMSALDAKRQQFVEDINSQKIDPNQYISSLGTGGKIMTAIGLIMGGIGAGLQRSNNNMALDVVNNLINRDIEGQRLELDRKKSLLSMNMQEMGSLKEAEAMTRAMMNDAVANQLKIQAEKAQSPIAKARAMQAAGQLDQQTSQLVGSLAAKQAIMSGAQGQGVPTERIINAVVPEADRKQAREELSMVNGYKSAVKGVSKLFKESQGIGGVAGNMPMTQTKAAMGKIRASITNEIRQNMKGQGSFSDQDQKVLIDPLLPAATDTIAQLKEKEKGILNVLAGKIGPGTPTLKGYGINVDIGEPGLNDKEQALMKYAKANPQDPNSAKILQRLGK